MTADPGWLTFRMPLEFTDDPAAFLDATRDHLAADPVQTTVIATVTARYAAGTGSPAPYRWWVIARGDRGQVTGVGMRTAPFAPYPLYLLPMPDDAALELARVLHERGEVVSAVNGALPTARVVADETARLSGRTAVVDEHLRLFELGELVVPPAPVGRLRPATRADAELGRAWFRAFGTDAAEQAGREGTHAMEEFSLEMITARIDDGLIWLWEDETGTPVHLTAANLPANGVTRIGPVYTPREQRGRGFASRAVAEVSRGYLEQGIRCCLFTDQANPTSNRIYQVIGYEPVVDMVSLLVE
ncbi:GNAT family N-acetyltransferase [Nocardioides aquiterrae]|uniref:GNAT family N-acetyltransferase n=2 Tax=Nocardioides aquiterrae TaxID=203799 RepID=A0ABP4FC83_9ACTN